MRRTMFDDDKFDKQFNRTFKIAAFFGVLWTLLCLAAAGGLVYVAIHFITKFW